MEGTIATIMLFAADFAPKNWAYCNGQLMSIAQNQALFSILGTTYGGDGRVTFGLPDFQGRTAIGAGQGSGRPSYVIGQKSGAENITLNQTNLATHTHPATAALTTTSTAPNIDEAPGNILAGSNIYATGTNGALGGINITPTGPAGQNLPVNIRQPYLGVNFVICLYGIFPSRN